jgi:hypothetical protein
VVLVTGESRPVEKTYLEGWIDCPWCGAAWDTVGDGDTCPNPGCTASRWADEEYVVATLARVAAEEAERCRRERDAERARRDFEAQRDADARLLASLRDEAAERGQCDTCLRNSDWRRRPRLVRHRNPDFHAQEGR